MEKAVAVKYIEDLPAPFVIAKGKGELAQIIKKIAADNNISLLKDINLTESLIELDVGSYIPEELYELIAKILVFVLDLRKKYATD
ncbi:MAG: hypothetical protein GXP33_13435 [Spirochaetes bacterium]|nr:hypothetical protein [Spirochaetota bacterium]